MKKVLVLTVIAILALGVMAMAAHVGGNADLTNELTATATITVDQWIDATATGYSVTITDYESAISEEVASIDITSNADVKIGAFYTGNNFGMDYKLYASDSSTALITLSTSETQTDNVGNGTYEVKLEGTPSESLQAQQNTTVTFTFNVYHTVSW